MAEELQFQFEKIPYPHYEFFLTLPTGPEKMDTLLKASNDGN